MEPKAIEPVVDGYGIPFPPEVQARYLEALQRSDQEYQRRREEAAGIPPQQLIPFHDKPAGRKSTGLGA